MNNNMKDIVLKGWPPIAKDFVIRPDDLYCQRPDAQQPGELFTKAGTWLEVIQNAPLDKIQGVATKEIQDSMVRAIFGSNQIERAGLNLDITTHLCRRILNGEDVGAICEGDLDCQSTLLELYLWDPALRKLSRKDILRSRNEVVQHFKAFIFLIEQFVFEKKHLTESRTN